MKDKKELIRKIKFTLFSISAGIIELGLFELICLIILQMYMNTYIIICHALV